MSCRCKKQQVLESFRAPQIAGAICRNSIRISNQNVILHQLELRCFEPCFRKDSDRHGFRTQSKQLAGSLPRPHDNRRIVTGVHVWQLTRPRLVFCVEKGCEEIRRRGVVDETIDIADESGKVQTRVQRLCPKRRLETGHQQSGANSFTRYLTDRDPPTAARQKEKNHSNRPRYLEPPDKKVSQARQGMEKLCGGKKAC